MDQHHPDGPQHRNCIIIVVAVAALLSRAAAAIVAHTTNQWNDAYAALQEDHDHAVAANDELANPHWHFGAPFHQLESRVQVGIKVQPLA